MFVVVDSMYSRLVVDEMAKEGVGGTTGMPWATIVIHEACNPTV
jgi:hypothetical protein